MYNGFLVLLCISIASTLILAFLYFISQRELKFYKKKSGLLEGSVRMRTFTDNEARLILENSRHETLAKGLRSDVETGCRIIDDQKATINSLRGLLALSQQRNRGLKPRK